MGSGTKFWIIFLSSPSSFAILRHVPHVLLQYLHLQVITQSILAHHINMGNQCQHFLHHHYKCLHFQHYCHCHVMSNVIQSQGLRHLDWEVLRVLCVLLLLLSAGGTTAGICPNADSNAKFTPTVSWQILLYCFLL